jgi:site-specific DNA-methyltransferase (adenine-specific)
MNIIEKKIEDIKAYDKNPRKNDEAVKPVMASIKEFGFKVPIVIDKDNVIIAGHTRVLAAKELGMKKVPCIVADDLTDEQVKAFRLADNKVAEFSLWDFDLLNQELADLGEFDMGEFGFSSLVDDTVSYIDDLLENEYAEHRVDTNVFSITFVFEKDYQQEILEYIDENGKEKIVELIVNHVRGLD